MLVKDGGTPFFVACQCNHIEVADCLLKSSADIHVQVELILLLAFQRYVIICFFCSRKCDLQKNHKIENPVLVENSLDMKPKLQDAQLKNILQSLIVIL